MAYTPETFRLVKGGVINEWVYDSADLLETVLGAGYVTGAVAIDKSSPGKGLQEGDRVLFRRFGTVGTPSTFAGAWDLVVKSVNTTTGAATLIPMTDAFEPFNVSIALAASATTDGMTITVTVLDADGNTLAGVYAMEMYMSEAATGIGLTGDTYSGDLTAVTGGVAAVRTSKKAWLIQTHTTGIFVGTLVDSANPADQYVVVVLPSGQRVVSAASGTNWEGA